MKPTFLAASLALSLGTTALVALPASQSAQATTCPAGWELINDPYVIPGEEACDKFVQVDSTVTIPEGFDAVSVIAIGGGGAGGPGGEVSGAPRAGGGGGAGEISQDILRLSAGDILTIDIGSGGTRGSISVDGSATNGGDGETTTVSDSLSNVLVSAVGGKGGESGTNGGDGGASGSTDPLEANAGGAGYNVVGNSSGGGGGGFSSPGVDGASLNAGDGGSGSGFYAENGMPSYITTVYSVARDAIAYPGYYPSNILFTDLGYGGGGGLYRSGSVGCTDEMYGNAIVPDAGGMGEGYGSCLFDNGYGGHASNDEAGAFPGQGGQGGAGYDDTNASGGDEDDRGTVGVDGIVWLRIFPNGAPPVMATTFSFDSDTLPYGGSIGVVSDYAGGYETVTIWVDGNFVANDLFPGSSSFSWEYFSYFASCEGMEITMGLTYTMSPFDAPLPENIIATDSFFLEGDPGLCSGGGSGGGDSESTTPNLVITKVSKSSILAQGDTFTVYGRGLKSVTDLFIGTTEVFFTVNSDGTLRVSSPSLVLGQYDLTAIAPGGKAVLLKGIWVVDDLEFSTWTKRSGDSIKIYAKNVVGVGKVQFFVDGRELAWVNAVEATDPKLRTAYGFHYLVRTVTLKADGAKTRFEVKLNGDRVRRNTYTINGN